MVVETKYNVGDTVAFIPKGYRSQVMATVVFVTTTSHNGFYGDRGLRTTVRYSLSWHTGKNNVTKIESEVREERIDRKI